MKMADSATENELDKQIEAPSNPNPVNKVVSDPVQSTPTSSGLPSTSYGVNPTDPEATISSKDFFNNNAPEISK